MHSNCISQPHGRHKVSKPGREGKGTLALNYCLDKEVIVSAEHLPGVDNITADYQFRLLQTSAEWQLHAETFRKIAQRLGPCRTDLFATRINTQLEQYVSWKPDLFAVATDAMKVGWKERQGYAFQPFCLVGRCLSKLAYKVTMS